MVSPAARMMTRISPTSKNSNLRPVGRVGARARQGGFTLLEMVVVIAIVAILFFALQPNLAGMLRGSEERTALRQLVGLFNYARVEAVGKGCLVRVVYDPNDVVFRVERQSDPAVDRAAFEPIRVQGRSKVGIPEWLDVSQMAVAGQEVHQQSTTIYFYPDGRTDGASLVLADDKGRQIVIEISATTGRVTISV